MTPRSNNPNTADICLMLRAHAEESWLRAQVLPAVCQLEDIEAIPDGQLGAALAYLEVLWIDATSRAAETEAALAQLRRCQARGESLLYVEAGRLHTAVSMLRAAVADRVARLTAAPLAACRQQHAVL